MIRPERRIVTARDREDREFDTGLGVLAGLVLLLILAAGTEGPDPVDCDGPESTEPAQCRELGQDYE